MKVANYVAGFLKEKEIKDVFLIDGAACAHLICAVADAGLPYHCPLHEQAGAFMIDGYQKASGRMSVMIATSGPGAENLVTGIATCYYDGTPAIFLTGQINSNFINTNPKLRQVGFQETDVVSIVEPITKYAVQIKKKDDIKEELEKAWRIAQEGRPGPVLLDIPMNIQHQDIYDFTLFGLHFTETGTYPVSGFYTMSPEPNYEISKKDIDKIKEFIENSKRPAILVGGGVKWNKREVLDLIEKWGIPFFETWNAVDFCDDTHPLFGGRVGTFGGDGRNFGIQNSDLLIAIGSRISGRITGGEVPTFAQNAKKVFVNVDEAELRYNMVTPDIPIVSDAKTFVKTMNAVEIKVPSIQWWVDKVKEWKAKYPVVLPKYYEQKEHINPYVFIEELSKVLSKDDIIVTDIGGNGVTTAQAFKAKEGQILFANNGNASLGYALPASIGAAIATGKRVICLNGDGGLNFNIQELATLNMKNLNVKLFIYNNSGYGITHAFRQTNCDSNFAGADTDHGLAFPDVVKVAKAFGLKTVTLANHKELEYLPEILEMVGPVVINLDMKDFYEYSPKLGWGTPIHDQAPKLPRDEYEANIIVD
jgi:acetolactate synthase-1/2/3 large subunit